jgi:hypothetical protein
MVFVRNEILLNHVRRMRDQYIFYYDGSHFVNSFIEYCTEKFSNKSETVVATHFRSTRRCWWLMLVLNEFPGKKHFDVLLSIDCNFRRTIYFRPMLEQKKNCGPKWVFPSLKPLPVDCWWTTWTKSQRVKHGAKRPRFSLLTEVLVGNPFSTSLYSK